ncbi:hypothetical protein BDN72DRAFT_841113 [Pluteus cervinus]|uniref:Uncharacterized protein n=1 Tax=Pluteus cervinus TaxID=181527 RepID=A0ACD3ATX5_9AGAR|nr:hypothetical protein BDN72DRAFT_841113 [Pluteus cervinus]
MASSATVTPAGGGTAAPGASASTAPNAPTQPIRRLLALESFFAEYPLFTYIPTNHPSDEFARLKSVYHWGRKGRRYKEAKRRYNSALVIEFGKIYGSDEGSLDSWKMLCDVLGVEDVPETISACKKIVKRTHVNLVDLVATFVTGKPVEIFRDQGELRTYTRGTMKIFPKERAKSSSLLKCLLRPIF